MQNVLDQHSDQMRSWSCLILFNYYGVLEQARDHLTRRSSNTSKTTLSSCTGIHKGADGASYSAMTDPGEGPGGAVPPYF